MELNENSELARLIANSDNKKEKVIINYLMEQFGGTELKLGDGSNAIIDKKDAKKLANRVNDTRISELSDLKRITKNSKYLRTVDKVQHGKFDEFKYYIVQIFFREELSKIYLNRGKFDGKYHLYAITKVSDEENNI